MEVYQIKQGASKTERGRSQMEGCQQTQGASIAERITSTQLQVRTWVGGNGAGRSRARSLGELIGPSLESARSKIDEGSLCVGVGADPPGVPELTPSALVGDVIDLCGADCNDLGAADAL